MKKKFVLIIIFLLLLVPFQAKAEVQFKDVNSYKEEIQFLVNEGIIQGYPDGTFRPSEFVTKKQIAVMMARTLKLDLSNITNPGFKDILPSYPAYKEIAAVVNAGIMPKGTYFKPGEPATRELMARAIVVGLELQGDTSIIFKDVYSTNANKAYISILADNNITTGYEDGTFKPTASLSRAHFSAFLARALNESFKPIGNKDLNTQQIVEMHDSRILLLYINDSTIGSGILLGNGLVLTNHHVIDEFKYGSAYSIDDQIYEIEGVVVSDELKDLALIKLKQNVQASKVSFRRYEDLNKGEKVVAIGNPKGLQNTVSEGIVSALRVENNVKKIQQTAQITNGSSGGGLFDMKGNLIGVTTSGIKEASADLNFSVSINELDPWKSFFNLTHSQLRVKPLEIPAPVYENVYRNVAFGMSPGEVVKAEGISPTSSTSDTLFYLGVTDRGLEANVGYNFRNNQLHSIYLQYVGFEYLTIEDKEGFFLAILEELEDEYGLANSYDFDWADDNTDYKIAAYWYYPWMSWSAVIPDSYSDDPYASILIVRDLD